MNAGTARTISVDVGRDEALAFWEVQVKCDQPRVLVSWEDGLWCIDEIALVEDEPERWRITLSQPVNQLELPA